MLFPLITMSFIAMQANPVVELSKVNTSKGLARFIHQMLARSTRSEDLQAGLSSSACIRIEGSKDEIPVREVFGTIIEIKYEERLGPSLFVQGTNYKVREICSFIDRKNGLHRYHINIFEEAHYKVMMEFLKSDQFGKKLVITPLVAN